LRAADQSRSFAASERGASTACGLGLAPLHDAALRDESLSLGRPRVAPSMRIRWKTAVGLRASASTQSSFTFVLAASRTRSQAARLGA
jgi:hypothetical protein